MELTEEQIRIILENSRSFTQFKRETKLENDIAADYWLRYKVKWYEKTS